MDKKNFEKDIDIPSKRLDRIDNMEIDLANYEQMERDIEKVIEPYQLNWELDCLSLPNAIQSILERKEQECEELKNEYWKLEQGNDFLAEKNSKLKGCLAEIKEIAEKNLNIHTCAFKGCGYDLITKQILQKISEVEDENN